MNNTEVIAFAAAQRIIDKLTDEGIILTIPDDIIIKGWNLSSDLHYNWGASRIVIWDDEYDYVIKIARCKEYERYNAHEVEVYRAAVDEGFEENFGWCACYCEPLYGDDGYYEPGIYVMEFLDGEEDAVYDEAWYHGYLNYCQSEGVDSSDPDVEKEYNKNSDCDDEELLINYLESLMDGRKVNAFEAFLGRWNINDLHGGNFLYRNDRPVICDYAGWGWC